MFLEIQYSNCATQTATSNVSYANNNGCQTLDALPGIASVTQYESSRTTITGLRFTDLAGSITCLGNCNGSDGNISTTMFDDGRHISGFEYKDS